MKSTLLLFLAPDPAPQARRPAAATRPTPRACLREQTLRDVSRWPVLAVLRSATCVVASAAGFVALIAGSWLLLPVLAVLVS